MARPPRYVPARALPSHDRPEPGAEARQGQLAPVYPIQAHTWRDHASYLWGVDLYNHGYPWQAHEAWEELWRLAAPGSPERALLQGLIQCAAAVLKARSGQLAGLATLAARADRHLARVADSAGPCFLGVDVARLRHALRAYAAARPVVPEAWPILEIVD